MKTAALLPDEVKSPHKTISSAGASSLLHSQSVFISPARGDFIPQKKRLPAFFCWLVRSISMFRNRKSTVQKCRNPLIFQCFFVVRKSFFSVKSASVPFKCLECTLILLLKKARSSSLSYHSIALITTLIRIIIFTDTT